MHWPTIFTTSNPTVFLAIAWFFVNSLAVFRLSRLVALDSVTARFRQKVNSKFTGSLVELINCVWCLSVWFAAGALVLMLFKDTRPIWLCIAIWLAASAVAGILHERAG
jgi:hypothetical protein